MATGAYAPRILPATVRSAMRVWIDQDLCTGDGLCVDHCPDVFMQLEDGIAYVRQGWAAAQRPGRIRVTGLGRGPQRPVRHPRR